MRVVLEVRSASIAIGGERILEDISLRLEEAGIACLVGPSGCGKTTLLRGIAGFVETVSGDIRIDGKVVSASDTLVPVERRNVGMVFQDFALFPHLTVAGNIAFGIARAGKDQRVLEVASMLGVDHLLNAFPHMLSGGQQQRVALGRAMAPRPRILLLDEPFSGLDVALREQIAREIRRVLKHDGISAIMVTHNQSEAFAMADEIGLIRAGRLLQWGSPQDLYYRPSSLEVANFIGEGRFLPGKVQTDGRISTALGVFDAQLPDPLAAAAQVDVLIRPDRVTLDDEAAIRAKVVETVFRGGETAALLQLPDGSQLLALVPGAMRLLIDSMVGIRVELDGAVAFARSIEGRDNL